MPEQTRRNRARGSIKEALNQIDSCKKDLEVLTKRFEDYMEIEEDDHAQLQIIQGQVNKLESKPFNLDCLNFLGKLLFKIIGK
jgi:DNA-binding ferritin-like protein